MWILQYALQNDLENLRKLITKKFPKLNPKDLNVPNAELLTCLASLRIISKNYTSQLENPEDLDCLLKNIIEQTPNELRSKKSYDNFVNNLKMVKSLLQYRQIIINSNEEFHKMVADEFDSPTKKAKLTQEKELKKVVVDTSTIDEKIEKILPVLVSHKFITEFDSYLMKNTFNEPTFLEQFLQNKSNFYPSAEPELKILDDHVGNFKIPLDVKAVEKKLIEVIEAIAQETESKDPVWCPLIYITDPVTKADIGIRIKNAYERK